MALRTRRNPLAPKPKPETPLKAHASDRISLDLTGLDLTSALQRVCDQTKISYVFALQGCKAQKVTLALKDVSIDQAVQRILDAAAPSLPLRPLLERGVLMVCPAPGPHARPEPGTERWAERLKARVTARFRNEDLSLSLNSLLSVLEVNYGFSIYELRRMSSDARVDRRDRCPRPGPSGTTAEDKPLSFKLLDRAQRPLDRSP